MQETFSIRLDRGLERQIKLHCIKSGKTIKDYIEGLIKLDLGTEHSTTPTKQLPRHEEPVNRSVESPIQAAYKLSKSISNAEVNDCGELVTRDRTGMEPPEEN